MNALELVRAAMVAVTVLLAVALAAFGAHYARRESPDAPPPTLDWWARVHADPHLARERGAVPVPAQRDGGRHRVRRGHRSSRQDGAL